MKNSGFHYVQSEKLVQFLMWVEVEVINLHVLCGLMQIIKNKIK